MAKGKNTFIKQAAILAGAGIIVRVLGFLYRLPIYNMIGDVGNGIYAIGFYIYNLFLIMSSSGLPAAISKLVAARAARGRYDEARRVFKVALSASAVLGLIFMVIILFGAGGIVNFFDSPRSKTALLTLAPTVFIVSIMAVFRGYFQGLQSAGPTAISQLVEQLFNAIFSVVLAAAMMNAAAASSGGLSITDGGVSDEIAMGAAGGTMGTGVGALAGLAFLIIFYMIVKSELAKRSRAASRKFGSRRASSRRLLWELFSTSIPIIAGTAIFSFSNLIDAKLVLSSLEASGITDPEARQALYGQLTGKYVTITTLPVAISTALATAAIPSITASATRKDTAAVKAKIDTSMRVAMLISIPAAVGIGVLANQILRLLIPNYPDGGGLLALGSVSIIFLSLTLITTGMLQGVGRLAAPVIGALAGVCVKIPLNLILVANPAIRINGAVIATICCYIVTSAVGLYFLRRQTGRWPDFSGVLIKPAIASLGMGMTCYIAYWLPYYVFHSNTLWTLFSIVVGVLVYFLLLVMFKGLRRQDLLLMPGGERLVGFLDRHGAL